MKTPDWTTEPPTEPGWYWATPRMVEGWEDISPQIAEVYKNLSDRLKVLFDGNDDFDLADFTHWLGPLPLPEPPK